MTFLRKFWRRILVLGVLLILVAFSGVSYLSGSELASPTRRPLQDYHHAFLNNQTAYGIHITPFTASDETPCLIVTPDSTQQLGERGAIIREQLKGRGHALQPFGEVIGTLVLCHGRKGRKEDYLPIAERLCSVGFRCVIPDLPAHGEHPETIATYGIRENELPGANHHNVLVTEFPIYAEIAEWMRYHLGQ